MSFFTGPADAHFDVEAARMMHSHSSVLVQGAVQQVARLRDRYVDKLNKQGLGKRLHTGRVAANEP